MNISFWLCCIEVIIVCCLVKGVFASQNSFFCDFVGATNAASVRNSDSWEGWQCLLGLPVVGVCSWSNVQCTSGSVISISINSTALSGTIPSSISALTSLQQLLLVQNNLGGHLPSTLWGLTKLTILNVYANNFVGTVPSAIASLNLLSHLTLSGNRFAGSVPSVIGTFSSLTYLGLHSNSLNGQIPSVLGSLSKVVNFDLFANGFSGPIPSSFGSLTQAMSLVLHSNQLTGPIPSALGSITNVVLMDLSNNGLEDSVPSSFASLSKLVTLDLSGNALVQFAFPRALCDITNLVNFYVTQSSVHECLLPTPLPTQYPSRVPTTQPTRSPTYVPSVSPTVSPTALPTWSPTVNPSSTPTMAPTAAPTDSPTYIPTASPTYAPSISPTYAPTTLPTSDPTYIPTSSLPTSQPSGQPTGELTFAEPTPSPTYVPSVSPTVSPTALPTWSPTVNPSSTPTMAPTAAPTDSPTYIPTVNPTLPASSQPTIGLATAVPTHVATFLPISVPTGVPSGQPSSSTTLTPSAISTGVPSKQPLSVVSLLPSLPLLSTNSPVNPTKMPSRRPSSLPSKHDDDDDDDDGQSSMPTSVPSSQPSSVPTLMPPALSTVTPSGLPSSVPSSQPVSSTHPSSTSYSTGVPTSSPSSEPSSPSGLPSVRPSVVPGSLYPTSFPSGQPTRTPTLMPFAAPLSEPTNKPTYLPTILPTTGATTSAIVYVELQAIVLSGGSSIIDLLHLSLAGESIAVNATVQLMCKYHAEGSDHPPVDVGPFVPSLLYLGSMSVGRYFTASLPAEIVRGTYQLAFGVTGPDANDVLIVYKNGVDTFSLLDSGASPAIPIPNISSVVFSADGAHLVVIFTAPIDYAGLPFKFTCNALYDFVGSGAALCEWLSSVSMQVYPSGSHRIAAGDQFTLLGGKLRAECNHPANVTLCLSYPTAPSQTISASAAAHPIRPSVVVSSPAVLGPCTAFTLDLLASTGHMYHEWTSVQVTVSFGGSYVTNANDFFATEYRLDPPTALPYSMLPSAGFYKFNIQLCNIYSTCSDVYVHMLEAKTSPVHVLNVMGDQVRTVRRRDQLVLYSTAYVEKCGGSAALTGIVYEWDVRMNGTIPPFAANGGSISLQKSSLTIPGGILEVGRVYEIVLRISNAANKLAMTSSTVQVVVTKSAVKAVLAGASSRTVRLGDAVALDASGSYDMDRPGLYGAAAGLSHEWSCLLLEPAVSTQCPFVMSSMTAERITLQSSPSTAEGQLCRVSVWVYADSRGETVSITLRISAAALPVVNILSSSSSLRTLHSNRLKLSARVTLQSSAVAEWSARTSSGNLVALPAIASSTTRATLPVGTQSFNLAILPNTLPSPSTLEFTLSCASVKASVSVVIATPPVPGVLKVWPLIGVELVDDFTLSTSQWTSSSDQLPITYVFGFHKPSGAVLVLVQPRSDRSKVTSVLPRGGSGVGAVNTTCVVQAFNYYDAMLELRRAVSVQPVELSATAFGALIEERLHLAANLSSSDAILQTVSAGAQTLNSVNCSLTPNCVSLNRQSCASVAHTCGACLDGYLGEDGNSNSGCVSAEEYTPFNASAVLSCSVDAECGLYRVCNTSSSLCVRMPKACPGGCGEGMLGICEHRTRSSNNVLESLCYTGDPTCYVQCQCNFGLTGPDCNMVASDSARNAVTRNEMVTALEDILMFSDRGIDWAEVSGLVESVIALGNNRNELDVVVCTSMVGLMDTLLADEAVLMVPYDAVVGLSDVISNCMSVFNEWSGDATQRNAYLDLIRSIQRKHAAVILEGIVDGEDSAVVLSPLYRMSLSKVALQTNSSAVLSTPTTSGEETYGIRPTQIVLDRNTLASNENVSSVLLTESAAQLFENSSDAASNVIRLEVSRSGAFSDKVRIGFTLQQHMEFREDASRQQKFTTICSGYTEFTRNYTCENGYVISHSCNRTAAVLWTSACPWSAVLPECAVVVADRVVSDLSVCVVEEYSSSAVVCTCSMSHAKALYGRRLSVEDDTGYLEAVAMSTYVGEGFYDTLVSAEDVTLSDIAGSIRVLLLYGILWISVLGVVMLLIATDISARVIPESEGMHMSRLTRRAAPLETPTDKREQIRGYLMKYVDLIVPIIFRPQQSIVGSLCGEVMKHHRFIRMFSRKSGQSSSARFRTAVQMLTVLSMVFFLMSIFFELEYQRDDGSCVEYTNAKSCSHEKSLYDRSRTRCQWVVDDNGDELCIYQEVNISTVMLIIVVMLLAVFTAPINLVIDFVFDNILAAPTAEEQEAVAKASDGFQAKVRRASGMAVRKAGNFLREMGPSSSSSRRLHSIKSSFFLEEETIKLPEAVVKSYKMALAAVSKISSTEDEKDKHISIDSNAPIFQAYKLKPGDDTLSSHQYTIDRFWKELAAQRAAFESEIDRACFDEYWGLDKDTGVFLDNLDPNLPTSAMARWCDWGRIPRMKELLEIEIVTTRELALKNIFKLRRASDIHCGLEVFHLFVLDLLGRDTAPARIFQYKMEEEFGHSFLVTKTAKFLAWAFVIILNVFFMAFTVLRGIERDEQWQNRFVFACIVQLIVEICLFETMECLWIHFHMPRLVQSDVESAIRVLYRSLDFALTNDGLNNLILDVPQYLFVSAQVAKRHYTLFESSVVRAFQTCMGGAVVKKLRDKSIKRYLDRESDTWWTVGVRLLSSLSMTSVILLVGTLPLEFQRLVVHAIQPVVLLVLVMAIKMIITHPWMAFFPVLIGIYAICSCAKAENRVRERMMSMDFIFKEPLSLRNLQSSKVPPVVTKHAHGDDTVSNFKQSQRATVVTTDNRILGDNVDCEMGVHENRKSIRTRVVRTKKSKRVVAGKHKRSTGNDDTKPGGRVIPKPSVKQLFSLHSFVSNDGYDNLEDEFDGIELGKHSKAMSKRVVQTDEDTLLSNLEDGTTNDGQRNDASDGSSFHGDCSLSDDDSDNAIRTARPSYRGMYSIASSDEESGCDDDGNIEGDEGRRRTVTTFKRLLSMGASTKEKTLKRIHLRAASSRSNERVQGPPQFGALLDLEAAVHGDQNCYARRTGTMEPPVDGRRLSYAQLRKLNTMSSEVSEYDVVVRCPPRPKEASFVNTPSSAAL